MGNDHLWKPGQSGNPKGRPKKGHIYDLERAVKKVSKAKGKKFWVHFVETAWDDPGMLISIAKKFVADKKSVEVSGKLTVPLIPMTLKEVTAYEKAAAEIAQGEIQKQLTEGDGDD